MWAMVRNKNALECLTSTQNFSSLLLALFQEQIPPYLAQKIPL